MSCKKLFSLLEILGLTLVCQKKKRRKASSRILRISLIKVFMTLLVKNDSLSVHPHFVRAQEVWPEVFGKAPKYLILNISTKADSFLSHFSIDDANLDEAKWFLSANMFVDKQTDKQTDRRPVENSNYVIGPTQTQIACRQCLYHTYSYTHMGSNCIQLCDKACLGGNVFYAFAVQCIC